ncbi:MAG TPA: TolC family protein [Polyangia bacterium]|jgi:cobalt-zinc-cadmium efflux system outer membrane protein|nr:TolC family protein [Polyangia bacterium]
MRSARLASILSFTSLLLGARVHAQGDDARGARETSGAEEGELAQSARLETILRVALDRNPDLAESQARASAAEARTQAASRLPDLELKYEQWGVPLSRPYALDQAQTLMLGVRQTFPAWGSLDARERAAAEEAGGARDRSRARRQEVAAQVRRTFATYYEADQELRLHLEHVGLTSRVLELARLNQRTGHGSLQDVLRLELELTRLHTDVARIEREDRSSRALLNALMDRPPDAPLGPPQDLTVLAVAADADVARLEKDLEARRPEIGAAARAVRRSEAMLDDARRSARYPSIMVGLDYWYLPTATDHQAYGAMVGINLPWFSGRHGDEQRAAEQTMEAEKHAFESTKNAVRYELRDAAARVAAAKQSFTIIDQTLLAQARRSLEATQAEYAAGHGDAVGLLDAMRSYLQVRIERVRALADLAASEADLERAAGTLAVEGEKR